MLLPVFMIATIYYYTHPAANPSLWLSQPKKENERQCFFPDGSLGVMLNGSSSISYDADAFSRGNRNIEFSGEAFSISQKIHDTRLL